MIWRSRYSDQIREQPRLTSIQAFNVGEKGSTWFPVPGLTLGAFEETGAGELQMWRKLLESIGAPEIYSLWLGVDAAFVKTAIPRSLHETSYVCDELCWRNELSIRQGDKTFAIFTNQEARLAFLGLPTEEGLDKIIDFIKPDERVRYPE